LDDFDSDFDDPLLLEDEELRVSVDFELLDGVLILSDRVLL
jgi:hypothetical protein